MIIERLSPSEQRRMHAAGVAAANTLALVERELAVGMTTADIDSLVAESTRKQGGTCAPLHYGSPPFPRSVCTSVNAVVCHGIPSAKQKLRAGDIVNVDVTTKLDGMHGDTSKTFCVGAVPAETRRLVDTCKKARDIGIAVVRDGVRLNAIGTAIEDFVVEQGFSVVREFGGHGIGREMHQDPHVSHCFRPGPSPRLKAGMAITIEPIICAGRRAVRTLDDEWTVVTVDGSLSAQFEHTLIVTQTGSAVTTLPTRE